MVFVDFTITNCRKPPGDMIHIDNTTDKIASKADGSNQCTACKSVT